MVLVFYFDVLLIYLMKIALPAFAVAVQSICLGGLAMRSFSRVHADLRPALSFLTPASLTEAFMYWLLMWVV